MQTPQVVTIILRVNSRVACVVVVVKLTIIYRMSIIMIFQPFVSVFYPKSRNITIIIYLVMKSDN